MKRFATILCCLVLTVSCDNTPSNDVIDGVDTTAAVPAKPEFYNAQALENTLPIRIFDTHFHMPSTGAIEGIRTFAQREYETYDFGNIIVGLSDFGLAGAMEEEAALEVSTEVESAAILQERNLNGIRGMVVLDTLFSRGSLRYHVAPTVALDIRVATVPVQDIRWLDTVAARIDVVGIANSIKQLEKE